jgi:putative transposase
LRKADKWYASISLQCDVTFPDLTPHGHPIGIDIGLSKFLATSEGVLVKPPKFLLKLQSEMKLLQRRLLRKKKRSKNYEKQRIKVARLHHQIDNTRKDFHYKQAHALCDVGDMVFMEDLDYRISAKGMFGKHMLDAAFGQFRSIVKYVCWKQCLCKYSRFLVASIGSVDDIVLLATHGLDTLRKVKDLAIF